MKISNWKSEKNHEEDVREEDHNEGKETKFAEMGSQLGKADEGPNFGRLKSGGELVRWKVENRQSKIQSCSTRVTEFVGHKETYG